METVTIFLMRKATWIKYNCGSCGKEIQKRPCDIKRNKGGLFFCSKSCAIIVNNTKLRSGANHPMHKKSPFYRTICFLNHKKECIICKEANIVEVHHYDGNHKNHDPKNLIPLCPTHHQYMHSRYRELIESKISGYINHLVVGKPG